MSTKLLYTFLSSSYENTTTIWRPSVSAAVTTLGDTVRAIHIFRTEPLWDLNVRFIISEVFRLESW